MLFRPTRIVRVTSKEDFDAAFASADQVIVEGDDRLLSYAAAKAAKDLQLSSVAIEVGGHSISVGRDIAGSAVVTGNGSVISSSYAEREEPLPASPNPDFTIAATPRASPSPPALRSSSRLPLVLFISIALLASAVACFAWLGAEQVVPSATSGAQAPSITGSQGNVIIPPPSPSLAVPVTPASSANLPQLVQSMAWPAVAIAAIVALFFIARQAIAGGRDVEISWKVTEKVAGRVVITKVRSKADKVRATA